MSTILLSSSSAGFNYLSMALLVVMFGLMYFFMIRPQKKEQQQKEIMIKELEVGDSILTSAGFYGSVVDIQEDLVIVEFGNNRNCRIPMQKSAIVQVEKQDK
ncbi:preprotein translocase subunit YajC [Lachnobacterium bovis]|uniref:Preprotein translocase subunit YajC n=1 Tax=Lachnobacterium bovis DSM 14045 TaxID=1122142 RepID=A0A1H3HLZ7_9FIRM|nr:preprotein translocase subunit YajC [Lachnobacterium bovis]SDY16521.1 preprotein translocase subunit YajC [Lachnobacterium bovis DSM 14045]